MRFQATILQSGTAATGIQIPDEVIAALGAGKKPSVTMNVNGHTYRSTVATVDGKFMVGFSVEHRDASGLGGGDEVDVQIEVDMEPRTVELPADFQAALDAEPRASQTFDKLSNSNRGYHVTLVTSAKTDETRQRRIEKSISALREGKAR